jgi:acyl dehydratase
MMLADLSGHDLGRQSAAYDARDAILYALAVGAPSTRIDLVYERGLRTLPTLAYALGLWAVEAAGDLGAYDRTYSLHASQSLTMHRPMPAEGKTEMAARIANVWDKGKAALVEIEVESEVFTAGYGIFLPGFGGFSGERGPSGAALAEDGPTAWEGAFRTGSDLAALYRLTGDRHPIHIDPEIARANGFDRPILHGLCTLGIALREIADGVGAHPCDLREMSARLAEPVMPGDRIDLAARPMDEAFAFEARIEELSVLKDGRVRFSPWVEG